MTISHRRKALYAAAWTFMVCGLILVGWQLAQNTAADEADRTAALEQQAAAAERERDAICEALAVQNQRMTDLLTLIGTPRVPPPGATPAQIEGYRVTNAERDSIRALGSMMFVPDSCADGQPPPPFVTPGTTTTTTTTTTGAAP